MDPDISKYFFTELRSKIPQDIVFSIFFHAEHNKFAVYANRDQAHYGALLDEKRFNQVSYVTEIANTINLAFENYDKLQLT